MTSGSMPADTLYGTFSRTVARWGGRSAYAVPPMAGRGYHEDGWERTWAETAQAVEVMRMRYQAAGYGPGHRVAILFAQRPEFFFHYYALNSLGVSVVPVNPDHRAGEISYLMEHSESVLALSVESAMETFRTIHADSGDAFALASFEDELAPLPEARTPAGTEISGPDTETSILYTSGTTGRPKGCVLTNRYFHTFGSWYLSCGGLASMREGEERMYNPLPLHHANCLSISTPAMLLSGGCLIFPDRFHASTWWQDLVDCRVSAVHMQGIIPNVLLKLPESEYEKKHEARFAFCAGIEPGHHAAFEERFGLPVVEFWAMTETGRVLTDCTEPRRVGTRSFGRAVPGLEARVVDEEGKDCPDGAPGEFVIRHREEIPRLGFFSGYLKDEEATEEAWRDGWFHTGDVAVRDGTGMFSYVDRLKNIIRRSGENIAAAEVEACLVSHPGVSQAAAIAVPDDLRDEEIMACIVPMPGQSPDETLARAVQEWCLSRLAYFKAPAWIVFRENLATGTSAKLLKRTLFPEGMDPRDDDEAIDLRASKKRS